MKKLLTLLPIIFLLSACGDKKTYTDDPDGARLQAVHYYNLTGWENDKQSQAFDMFVRTCPLMLKRAKPYATKTGAAVGDPQNWRDACAKAQRLHSPSDLEARKFFEANFTPHRVTTRNSKQGRFTGYYEPLLRGSYKRSSQYNVPVYGVPRDLHKPYRTRAQIVAGRVNAPILLYVDDAVMLFFLHIQGSGKVRLPDGNIVGLQYAEQNGYGYVPIGRVMQERGLISTVSLQSIRDWLYANPARAEEIMSTNPSYVFFHLSPGGEYAKGAIGLPLTPGRSIAIDDDRAAYGVPTYINTRTIDPVQKREVPLRRLMLSQDTGGAIIAAHRGDIFFGRGEFEEYEAGHQNFMGNVYWLLPN
jgi:membrane-bound lytic murein transglycosylase A